MSNRLIISDRNYRDHVKRCEDEGQLCGCLPDPAFPSARLGVPFAEKIKIIPRAERKKIILARRAAGRTSLLRKLIDDAKLPCYYQGGTSYCWAHAGTLTANIAWIASGRYPVEFAPEGVAVPVTGGRNRGGTLTEALDRLRSHGAPERWFIPQNELRERFFEDGWKENALLHRIGEVYPVLGPNIWDQIATGSLGAYAFMVGLDWWGHAVTYTGLTLDDDDEDELIEFRNSHGADYGDDGYAYLTESRGTPVEEWGIYAVKTMQLTGPTNLST